MSNVKQSKALVTPDSKKAPKILGYFFVLLMALLGFLIIKAATKHTSTPKTSLSTSDSIYKWGYEIRATINLPDENTAPAYVSWDRKTAMKLGDTLVFGAIFHPDRVASEYSNFLTINFLCMKKDQIPIQGKNTIALFMGY